MPTEEPQIHEAALADLGPELLYALLRLRTDVFVVEQRCPYPELDGRDVEPGARHWWIERDGRPLAYLRTLREDDETMRIGRVVTDPGERGHGLAGRLLLAAVGTTDGELVLDAQAHLARWYRRFGFEIVGEVFVEDGIDHLPMRRARRPAGGAHR